MEVNFVTAASKMKTESVNKIGFDYLSWDYHVNPFAMLKMLDQSWTINRPRNIKIVLYVWIWDASSVANLKLFSSLIDSP